MRPSDLSVRLPIVGLAGLYPTNYLIGREPISERIAPLIAYRCLFAILCGISTSFPVLFPSPRQVAHVLLARPPLSHTQHYMLSLSAYLCSAINSHPTALPPLNGKTAFDSRLSGPLF